MKVALVYDRVNKWGGAERVLLAFNEIFPQAPLYTAVYSPDKAPWAKVFPEVIPSFLQRILILNKNHELLGAFTPFAFEQFDFSDYDLVISVTSESAKGIIVRPPTKHICYCLTPTRYLWSGHDFYLENPQKLLRLIPFYRQISKPFLAYAKYWDKVAAQRPDSLVAISTEVKKRIKKYYHRDSQIVFPPVDKETFQRKKKKNQKEDFYLIVSRLEPYKRVDLAIEAFNELGYKLVIIGTGGEKKKLERIANENIRFLGHLTDSKLALYYQKAKALIFPQEEDFGLAAVEAQSAGTPIIAFQKGGILDIVNEGETGIYFKKQEKKSLIDAVNRFERMKFDSKIIEENVKRFSKARFKKEFMSLISNYERR